MASDALARCVSIPSDRFASQHWGARPLLTQSAELPADFSDLFCAAAVDELVSRRGLRTPFARMAKDGSVLPAGRYTGPAGTGAGIADQLADEKVLAQLADGATLVLQALHRTWAPLIEFSGSLSGQLGHPVQINAYITPPGNRGFSAHYDTHDVFVLQVAGGKRWRVHEPVIANPLQTQGWESVRAEVAERAREEPLLDVVLQPGDCLYLPRGFLHQASADDDLCVHLTVGVHPLTTVTLLHHLVDVAAQDASLRASLPAGIDVGDTAAMAQLLQQAGKLLLDRAGEPDEQTVAEVTKRLTADRARSVRPAPLAPLAQLAAMAGLTEATVLRRRAGLQVTCRLFEGQLELKHAERRFLLSAETSSGVDVALAGRPFTPSEFSDLDPGERLALARRLLAEGVVVAVEPT